MVEPEEGREPEAGILRRWSRRKLDTPGKGVPQPMDSGPGVTDSDKAELADQAGTNPSASAEDALVDPSAQTSAESLPEEPLLSDEDMPAIETISKDSDVSCFFNRGVSEQLRQRALRHLLRLPAFNITDGLNDYDEDYTTFEPLGDIVTSDMKFHARRKEKLAAQQREEEETLAAQEEVEPETGEPDSNELEATQDDTPIDDTADGALEVNEQDLQTADSAAADKAETQLDAASGNAAPDSAGQPALDNQLAAGSDHKNTGDSA